MILPDLKSGTKTNIEGAQVTPLFYYPLILFIMTTLTLTDGELDALQHYLEHVIVDGLGSFRTTSNEDNEWWDKKSSLSLAKKVGILN